MSELQPFSFGAHEVRTILIDGSPWFVAADVAQVLGYSATSAMTRRIDPDEKGVRDLHTLGGTQSMTVISEPGVYEAIFGSQVPNAIAFKRWIKHEVLPQIRKTGSYSQPLTEIEVAERYLLALREKQALAAKIEADAPKVLFADSVATSKTSILVGDLAKILKGNGVDVGANRLFERLRQDGYLIRRKGTDWNMPTQRSMELGLFEIKETAVSHSDGHVTVSKTPKVTGKGQTYFVNLYLNRKEREAA